MPSRDSPDERVRVSQMGRQEIQAYTEVLCESLVESGGLKDREDEEVTS